MMKWQISLMLALAFLILPTLVSANNKPNFTMCGDSIFVNQNCTLVTPDINCSAFNYSIINVTSGLKVVDEADMIQLNGSIYWFNFTLITAKGDYLVRLCDGTTKEVSVEVEDEDQMFIAAAIILAVTFSFFVIASLFLEKKHWPLKVGLFYGAIGLGWGGLNVMLRFAEDAGASTKLQDSLEIVYVAYTWISLLAFAYLIVRVLLWLFILMTRPNQPSETEEGEDGVENAW